MEDRWVGAAELGERIGVSQGSVYVMRHRNQLPPAVRIGRRLRWRLSDVDQWLAERIEREQTA